MGTESASGAAVSTPAGGIFFLRQARGTHRPELNCEATVGRAHPQLCARPWWWSCTTEWGVQRSTDGQVSRPRGAINKRTLRCCRGVLYKTFQVATLGHLMFRAGDTPHGQVSAEPPGSPINDRTRRGGAGGVLVVGRRGSGAALSAAVSADRRSADTILLASGGKLAARAGVGARKTSAE